MGASVLGWPDVVPKSIDVGVRHPGVLLSAVACFVVLGKSLPVS